MKFFSKFKDYNSYLEKILDKKTFSSASKNLFLSMIYKLSISYGDYSKVKINSIPQNEFFDNILNIIKENIDNVKLAELKSSQSFMLEKYEVEAVTNLKERSILIYQTEISALYAIVDIEPKYYFIRKDFLLKDALQKMLVEGYKQNTVEILKDFNGWSWDIRDNSKMKYTANIIYQNLIMILGEDFLTKWRKDNQIEEDYLEILKKEIINSDDTNKYFFTLCKLLYLDLPQNEREVVKQKVKKINLNNPNYKFYNVIIDNTRTAYDELIESQIQFLKYIKYKIEKSEQKNEIINILYQLRYYQNILLYEGVFVKNNAKIKKILNYIVKLAVIRATKIGALKVISLDIENNFEIIKYILDTKIINLESIRINIDIDDSDVYVKVYDKEAFEKEGKLKINGNKKDIVVKKNKLIKLFN